MQRDRLSRLWQRKAVRWATLIVVLIGVVIAVRYVPVLRNWISERDTGKGGQFMLHIPNAPGVKQLILLVGFVDMVTIPVVLGGLVGIYLLRQRNRPLARLLNCLWIFPVGFIFLVLFAGLNRDRFRRFRSSSSGPGSFSTGWPASNGTCVLAGCLPPP